MSSDKLDVKKSRNRQTRDVRHVGGIPLPALNTSELMFGGKTQNLFHSNVFPKVLNTI